MLPRGAAQGEIDGRGVLLRVGRGDDLGEVLVDVVGAVDVFAFDAEGRLAGGRAIVAARVAGNARADLLDAPDAVVVNMRRHHRRDAGATLVTGATLAAFPTFALAGRARPVEPGRSMAISRAWPRGPCRRPGSAT